MKGNSMSAEANVGVVGLAAMGGSLARNLAHHGNKVAVFNRTYARTEKLMNEHGGEGEFYPAKTLEEFVDSLVKPRTAIIMVSHDLGVVQHIADRILVLHDGRLEETGSTAEVLGNPQSDYTRQLIEAASL